MKSTGKQLVRAYEDMSIPLQATILDDAQAEISSYTKKKKRDQANAWTWPTENLIHRVPCILLKKEEANRSAAVEIEKNLIRG
jgi:hypothetical protein